MIVSTGHTFAYEEHSDNFNNLDLSKWTEISGSWQIVDNRLSGTGSGFSEFIFDKWKGTKYIIEFDFAANDTIIKDYVQTGFNFYYEDSDTFAQVYLKNDNRENGEDDIRLRSKGDFRLINTMRYNINTSINTSIEFNKNVFHHLKVVRLNKNIYIYFDNRLVLTTQFKDDNPPGNVGFDVYASTGYFDNFSLRPISMNNASGYLDKITLTSTNPTNRLGHYTLRFEGIEGGGDARFSLSKYGKKVDTVLAQAGSTVSLNFENGDTGVEFKLVDAMNDGKGGIVQLEDIISASSESTSVGIDNITLLPEYHQDENMNISFSIANPGGIGFSGMPSITINSKGSKSILNPDLDLGAGKSQTFEAVLKAPKTPGVQKLTINLELDDIKVTKSVDYNVTMLNPLLTTLSSDFIDDNGISGTVTFDSAYPDKFVKWDTNITMQIFRIVQNGRERTYFKNISVMENKDYNIYVPYTDFYLYDGQYLISITLGNMKNERLFKIKGPDGIYDPAERSEIIMVNDIINSQLILLLIGMVAAFSIRNYKKQKSNITIDIVIAGCGSIIFIAGIFHGWIYLTVYGIFMSGIGLMLKISRKNDARVNKLISLTPLIHDIAILTIIFLTMAYLILQIPEWNPVLTLGTLTVYYIILNMQEK